MLWKKFMYHGTSYCGSHNKLIVPICTCNSVHYLQRINFSLTRNLKSSKIVFSLIVLITGPSYPWVLSREYWLNLAKGNKKQLCPTNWLKLVTEAFPCCKIRTLNEKHYIFILVITKYIKICCLKFFCSHLFHRGHSITWRGGKGS